VEVGDSSFGWRGEVKHLLSTWRPSDVWTVMTAENKPS